MSKQTIVLYVLPIFNYLQAWGLIGLCYSILAGDGSPLSSLNQESNEPALFFRTISAFRSYS